MFGGWGAWILHILFIVLMIFIAIVVIIIIACIRATIGVCERKFATVTTMVAHELSMDQPSLSNYVTLNSQKIQKTQKMKNLV